MGTIILLTFVGIWYYTNYCYIAGATGVLIRVTGVLVTLYMGRGRSHEYLPGIVPTRPLITLGFVARGSMQGDFALCKYMGLSCW